MKAEIALLQYEFPTSGWKYWQIDFVPLPGLSEDDFCSPRIYLCPRCQAIWARLTIPKKWEAHVLGVPCEQCSASSAGWLSRQSVSGSLLYNSSSLEWEPDIDLQLLQALPGELLARELNLHIRAWENEQHICDHYLEGILARTRNSSLVAGG